MGHGNSTGYEGDGSPRDASGMATGDDSEDSKWWKVALQKGLAGAAGESPQQGSPIAPIAPITTGIIERIKARRAAAKV